MMNNYFVKKNIKLSMDFDSYIAKHPSILDKIPYNSLVVFTVKGDEKFNRMSWMVAGRGYDKKEKVVEARKEGSRWNVRKFEFA